MASPQALGSMLTYNPLISSDLQTKLLAAQQQQAMAQALLGEGMQPLDLKDRQIGGVGYAISPLEGLGKMAQMLSGKYQQQQANEDYMNAFKPAPSGVDPSIAGMQGAQGQAVANGAGILSPEGQSILQGVPPNLQPLVASWASTNPGAAAEIISKFAAPTEQQKNFAGPAFQQWQHTQLYPGANKMDEKLGENAAGNAPAGTLPPGVGGVTSPLLNGGGGGQLPPVPLQPPSVGQMTGAAAPMAGPMNAADLAPPPGSPYAAMGASVPGAFDNTRSQPMPAQASAPPNPAGMTNDQYKAALESWKAGQSKRAEAVGAAAGEADKGAATIDSRLDNALDMIKRLRQVAPKTSYGIASEAQRGFEDSINSDRSVANADFDKWNSNLFTQELPAIVQSSGGRIDIPLVNAIKEASAIPPNAGPRAKMKAIDDVENLLLKVRENAHNQVGTLTGSAPNQAQYPSSKMQGTVNWVVKDGKLVRQ